MIDRMEINLVADLGVVEEKREKARADAARLDATRDMRDAIEPLWREFPNKLVGQLRAIHAERKRSGAA